MEAEAATKRMRSRCLRAQQLGAGWVCGEGSSLLVDVIGAKPGNQETWTLGFFPGHVSSSRLRHIRAHTRLPRLVKA